MAILVFVDLGDNPKNSLLIRNEINYILRVRSDGSIGVRFFGGRGFIISDVESIIYQFYTVKNVYHKHDTIDGRHFCLSFSPEYDRVTPKQAYYIAEEISEIFLGEYQIIFAVHEDTDNLHIHFFVNATSIFNGKMMNYDKKMLQYIFNKIKTILSISSLWLGNHPVKLMKNYLLY